MRIKYFLLGLCVWSKAAVAVESMLSVASYDVKPRPAVMQLANMAPPRPDEDATPPCDLAPAKSRNLFSWEPQGDKSDAARDVEPLMKLVFVKETMNMLSNMKSEIAIVSIIGPHRSDNSNFLNDIAKKIYERSQDVSRSEGKSEGNDGEKWEAPFDASPATSGGSDAVLVHIFPGCSNPLAERHGTTLLMLDTPGMWTPQRLAVQDAQVMALVESVSSVVLYNTHWDIGRDDLQLLSTALETTRALDVLLTNDGRGDKAQDQEEREQAGGMMSYPASLVWLLNSLPKIADGEDHAQNPITHVEGIQDARGRQRALKDVFNGFFTKQEAFALPYPVASDESNQEDNRSVSDLSDNSEKAGSAVEAILKGCIPKKLHDDTSNVNGEALVKFMNWFSQAVNVQQEDDESPTGLLEVLESQELATLEIVYKNNFQLASPLDADKMKSTREKSEEVLWRAIVPRSPERVGESPGGEGEDQGDKAELTSPRYNRRPVFVKKLESLMLTVYKEMCEVNVGRWSESEVAALQEELKGLEQKKKESFQGDETEEPPPLDHDAIMTKLEDRKTRWNVDIRDYFFRSLEDFGSDESMSAWFETVSDRHQYSLAEMVGENIKNQAQEWFTFKLSLLEGEAAEQNALEEMQRLADKADELAQKALSMTIQAVGIGHAHKIAQEGGWEKWLKEAPKGEEMAQGKDVGGDGTHDVNDNDNNGDERGDDEKQVNPSEKDGDDLAAYLLSNDYLPCIERIEPDAPDWLKAMDDCRVVINDKWNVAKTKKPELENMRLETLDKKIEEAKANRVTGIFEAILDDVRQKLLAKLDESLDSKNKYVLVANEVRLKYEKGVLVDGNNLQNIEKRIKDVISEIWEGACKEARKKHITKMKDATSFFSLAPLRFFGSPPFNPADCLAGGTAEKAEKARNKARDAYHRGTWGRRYLVTLGLLCTFFLTVVAIALLVAGRQLQHRQVAMAFAVAAAFHVIVLCLAVSEGLILGTRLWLLGSAGVLGYVASGFTIVGTGKRGTRGAARRTVGWSSVGLGGRGARGLNGSLMPLFREERARGNGTKDRESRTRHKD